MLGVEFGELVHFRRTPLGDRKDKLDSLWEDGIYLGHRTVSGESIIGTSRGVFKTRTLRHKTYGERWRRDSLSMVGGLPWKAKPSSAEAEEVMPSYAEASEHPQGTVELPTADSKD